MECEAIDEVARDLPGGPCKWRRVFDTLHHQLVDKMDLSSLMTVDAEPTSYA